MLVEAEYDMNMLTYQDVYIKNLFITFNTANAVTEGSIKTL